MKRKETAGSRCWKVFLLGIAALSGAGICPKVYAGEDLLGYVSGGEPLPKSAKEVEIKTTARWDKGEGDYRAFDTELEMEYGVTDRFGVYGSVKGQSIHSTGLIVDGYLPQENVYGLKASGVEWGAKYNFLKPAQDIFGLSTTLDFDYTWRDVHSGFAKNTFSIEPSLQAQKYLMEGRLVLLANAAMESTIAHRKKIEDLDPAIEWPTDPEVEIEFKGGAGVSYRFIPNWSLGAEVLYEEEYETEVGKERWSWFAGPSLHYGNKNWWSTLTWLPQLRGGGEMYDGQSDQYHLIEKTRQEVRLKIGINF